MMNANLDPPRPPSPIYSVVLNDTQYAIQDQSGAIGSYSPMKFYFSGSHQTGSLVTYSFISHKSISATTIGLAGDKYGILTQNNKTYKIYGWESSWIFLLDWQTGLISTAGGTGMGGGTSDITYYVSINV
jgi:hypothetical protein